MSILAPESPRRIISLGLKHDAKEIRHKRDETVTELYSSGMGNTSRVLLG